MRVDKACLKIFASTYGTIANIILTFLVVTVMLVPPPHLPFIKGDFNLTAQPWIMEVSSFLAVILSVEFR